MKTIIILLNTVCLLVIPFWSASQNVFPVTASVQIIPPYSVYLPDYAVSGSTKLRVVLVQNDLTQASYQLRLSMKIELNGQIIMRTARNFVPQPITLSPGVPTVIGGDELGEYLQTDHIDFIGSYSKETYNRTHSLPEGSYRISFTAYDYRRTEVAVSNEGTNIFFFQKNEPPILSYPICESRVEKKDPQFLTFNWITRHSPGALSDAVTEYVFELFQVYPKGSNAEYIANSTKPIYKQVTENTTLLYTMAEPALQDSMEYVWRVQASDRTGKEMYQNQGYSRACKFLYQGVNPFEKNTIPRPTIKGEATGEHTGKLSWTLAADKKFYTIEAYRVEYRAATTTALGEFEWNRKEFMTDSIQQLYNLEPDREFEARICWKVDGVYGPYSDVVKFRTHAPRQFKCGEDAASIVPANKEPLLIATEDMKIKVGQFNMTASEMTGSNGRFSGSGTITTPIFGVGVAVEFKNIFINSDAVMVEGTVNAVTEGITKFKAKAIDRQHKVAAFKNYADNVPDANASLPQLKEFAKALIELPDDAIENALALNKEETTSVLDAKGKISSAIKILDDPTASEEQKQEAEQNIRKTIKESKPSLDKLASGLGRGIQTVIKGLFKNALEFLDAYDGSDELIQQVPYWRDSVFAEVVSIRQRIDVPDTLMKELNDAHAIALPAWEILLGKIPQDSINLPSANKDIMQNGPNEVVATGSVKTNIPALISNPENKKNLKPFQFDAIQMCKDLFAKIEKIYSEGGIEPKEGARKDEKSNYVRQEGSVDVSALNTSTEMLSTLSELEGKFNHVYNDGKTEKRPMSLNPSVWTNNYCKEHIGHSPLRVGQYDCKGREHSTTENFHYPTIGVGYLIQGGEEELQDFCRRQPISDDEIKSLLRKEIVVTEQIMKRLFKGEKMTQCQFDALTSIIFNRGEGSERKGGGFKSSLLWKEYLKKGIFDDDAIKNAIINDGSKIAGGGRRRVEADIYNNCKY